MCLSHLLAQISQALTRRSQRAEVEMILLAPPPQGLLIGLAAFLPLMSSSEWQPLAKAPMGWPPPLP